MEYKIRILDSRIRKLLELSEETIRPKNIEQVILEALDFYFRRKDVKVQYIVPLLKRGVSEELIMTIFPGDDRVTREAIKDAKRLINHLEHL